MVIRASDRVARVLEKDERLIEVFVSISPTFERLRNPHLRKVMTQLVTVAAAARMAGIDEKVLVGRLNEALAASGDSGASEAPENAGSEACAAGASEDDAVPAFLASLPAENVVDLDVREDLRQGKEPFSRIMGAKGALPPDHVLRLRAIFEPVPLYHVLGKQGFAQWTERLADDDWRVWFYRTDEMGTGADPAGVAPAAPLATTVSAEGAPNPGDGGPPEALTGPEEVGESGADVVVLDVRGLEPPEPMVRTLAALEELPPGWTLVQINVRVPQFLLPRLDEMGFSYEVRERPEVVRVFIRRRDEP